MAAHARAHARAMRDAAAREYDEKYPTRPIGPFNWRVRVLRASSGSVTTETTAHLCDDQGRARCGIVELTNTKPAAISAARCTVCADPGEPLDEQRRRLPDTRPVADNRPGWGDAQDEAAPELERLRHLYAEPPAEDVADAMIRRMQKDAK